MVDRVITELKNSSLNESVLPEQLETTPQNYLPPGTFCLNIPSFLLDVG